MSNQERTEQATQKAYPFGVDVRVGPLVDVLWQIAHSLAAIADALIDKADE